MRKTEPTDAILLQQEAIYREFLNSYQLSRDVPDDVIADTPRRVVKMFYELLGGYNINVADLFKMFDIDYQYTGPVVIKGIKFYSLCEHHIMPMYGTVDIGYIPADDKVIGISKLGRLVQAYARRLQVQERMTQQLIDAMKTYLKPAACYVHIEAIHTCMTMRGSKTEGASTVTEASAGSAIDIQRIERALYRN